jgi:hypothetical protein
MLNELINQISAEYISEAKKSPLLMEDMAAMEKYMAESYSGRVFIELLQNADDAVSTSILVESFENNVIFANNGRPFSESDIRAICRTGASKKTRGTNIGYRGIGFKSTVYLSNEIIVYSNKAYFTFSKIQCAKVLNKDVNKIPTVRIPFLVDNLNHKMQDYVSDLIGQGYSTVFIFSEAKIDQFRDELECLNNGYFLFLRNINSCNICLKDTKKSFKIERKTLNGHKILSFSGNKAEEWLIVNKGSESIAMKLQNKKVVPCESDEALIHCFLPTIEKAPYRLKINADFSTDPSRKHITLDNATESAIDNIVALLFDTLKTTLQNNDEMLSAFIDILLNVDYFNPLNRKISTGLESLIEKSLYLKLTNGNKILVSKCKLLPDAFENSEKAILRTHAAVISENSISGSYYQNFPSVELLVRKFSHEFFSAEIISSTLSDEKFVQLITPTTYAKILSFVVSSAKLASIENRKQTAFPKIYCPTDTGLIPLQQLNNRNVKPQESIRKAITENLNTYDASILASNLGIEIDSIYEKENNFQTTVTLSNLPNSTIQSKNKMPVIAKWRSAEQQCIEIEKHWGNITLDVSRQNVGYDIESTTPDGQKRYIEVKLLSNSGAFSITNNEYTAAHQYGDQYFICLIIPRESEAKVVYIKNPLISLSFEKRVRQWEWACDSYAGEEFTIELK